MQSSPKGNKFKILRIHNVKKEIILNSLRFGRIGVQVQQFPKQSEHVHELRQQKQRVWVEERWEQVLRWQFCSGQWSAVWPEHIWSWTNLRDTQDVRTVFSTINLAQAFSNIRKVASNINHIKPRYILANVKSHHPNENASRTIPKPSSKVKGKIKRETNVKIKNKEKQNRQNVHSQKLSHGVFWQRWTVVLNYEQEEKQS